MRASTTLGSVVGGAIAALAFLPSAIGQDTSEIKSCVQTGYAMLKSCPCDEASFTFSLEGETRIVDNKVNLAIVLDGSGSIVSGDWILEKEFAQNAVGAFARRNLFGNGGTASYVQFSSSVISSGTFDTQDGFRTFSDGDVQGGGGTDIEVGVREARDLINAQDGTAAFMIVITDGNGGDPAPEADAARAEGTIVFAVGVGTEVSTSTLLAIGGDESNVFEIGDFDELDMALAEILSGANGNIIPCPSSNAIVTLDFGEFEIASAFTTATGGKAEVSGTTVTFTADNLEASLAEFTVQLDSCSERAGADVVVAAYYTDDFGNEPDLSAVTGVVVDSGMCDDPHMVGLSGQKIEWSGMDGGWYALLSGKGESSTEQKNEPQVNVRVTAPMRAEFPDRQLVTGVSILEGGHSLIVEVKDPYTTKTDGCTSQQPCLANGALRVLVDGQEAYGMAGSMESLVNPAGFMVSAANLPAECQPFGGDLIWANKFAEIVGDVASSRRRLRSTPSMNFPDWVLSGPPVAAPAWCAQFIKEHASTYGGPFALTESDHAAFRIETPSLKIRLNVGTNHQSKGGAETTLPDGRVLPELEFWQMNLGFEQLNDRDGVSGLSGLLGETSTPVVGSDGAAVMHGANAMRGEVEHYRVFGPFGTDFDMRHKH